MQIRIAEIFWIYRNSLIDIFFDYCLLSLLTKQRIAAGDKYISIKNKLPNRNTKLRNHGINPASHTGDRIE